jgi:hypothetical protein
VKLPCFMCEKRPARKLTAERDGSEYVNARDVVMFCSVRCAANYGLLWGTPEILENHHYCPTAKEWRPCPADECHECRAV